MNYKKTIPVPFQTSNIRQIEKAEDGNYTFSLFDLNFKTFFGKDLSGNELIFDRAMENEYKLCDSSIVIDGKKIFLLAVFQFDKQIVSVNKNVECNVRLDIETPIIANIKNKDIQIGYKEEFLHRRLAIQNGLRRAQIASRFNQGGKGVQKKIKAIDRFKEAEIRYVTSRIHGYSAKLIQLCLKNKCGVINIINHKSVKTQTKEDDFLLRNWSYFGLLEKIQYKAAKFNIEVNIIEKKYTEDSAKA